MIIRKLYNNVKAQNWFVVSLDLLVVIVGVFVGVFMSEISSERALQTDVQDALNVVKSQLESDLKNVDEIIEYRTNKLAQSHQAIDLLSQDEFDKDEFTEALTSIFSRSFTFFPNESGYSSIKDRGYLSKIKDPKLQISLANLYDRIYVRHTVIADESDSVSFDYDKDFIRLYWNIVEHDFIGEKDVARARLQNTILKSLSNSEWYISSLQNYVRPNIVSVLDEIEEYQQNKQ